ncbi:hypothetical protein Q6348_03410 [Isoptericola sp. b441]|uniref:Uncharacterized protein n=1 Tax=Actinotalea lenta TaxID=3064654 RepID=A0ABT9D6T9_9CELL|nr:MULTISPECIES: hypothetical protein [unclassified Isoptericola]MDO8106240.1 hypothetical protein [Isoptericola sp. b441]MDO8122040.1 hypothetical protein [Isoptericola sp. b490]
MTGDLWASAQLDRLAADLSRALHHLARAEPEVWRSPAAHAYRARLAVLLTQVSRLRTALWAAQVRAGPPDVR